MLLFTVPGNRRLPYLEKHPTADTDNFSEEKRLDWCQNGLNLVKNVDQQRNVEFLEKTETGKSKVYVLVSISSDGLAKIDIVSAYKCPTEPSIYIHIKLDKGDAAPIFQIISKTSRSLPTFEEVVIYFVKLVDEIVEGESQLCSLFLDLFFFSHIRRCFRSNKAHLH